MGPNHTFFFCCCRTHTRTRTTIYMDRSSLFNVVHLSISFFLVFMSYNVAQTFQTSSDYARDGAFAVGIIYLVFCLANLALSSYLIRLLGVRLTLILSSLTYVAFIAANIQYHRWLLFTAAFMIGLGAALLWTAQGVYLAVSITKYERANHLESSSSQGFINGIFFGIFQLNLTVGNLLTAYLFRLNYPQLTVFSIMTIIAGVGAVGLVFLRPVKIPQNKQQRSILASLSMLLDLPFLVLIPTLCYSGLAQGFIFASIPPLIANKSQKFLMFAIFGFVNACSSMLFGKLSDYLVRRLFIFVIGAVAHLTMYGLLLTIWQPPMDASETKIFVVMMVCLSIGDSIFMTQIYSIIILFYGETRPAEAFACIKIFQAGSTAIAYIAQVYVSFTLRLSCLIVVLSVALISLIYEHYCVISIDTGKLVMSKLKQQKTVLEKEEEENEVPLTTLHTTT